MVPVEIACPCAGTPHVSDTVSLRPKLGLVRGMLVQSVVAAAKRDAEETGSGLNMPLLTARITEAYLIQGVAEWTLVDALGQPIPVTEETIQEYLLSDFTIASEVADKADELYMQPVIGPLLAQASTSSPPTPINGSTSASSKQPRKPRKQSKRSSTSTTQTADTGTTTPSPVGGSSSSPSEKLAAG